MRACVCVCECYAGAHAGFANSSNTNKGRFASLNDVLLLYILSAVQPGGGMRVCFACWGLVCERDRFCVLDSARVCARTCA